VVRSKE